MELCYEMCTSLKKLKFVDGTIVEFSKDDSLYDSWERCNVRIVSWMVSKEKMEMWKPNLKWL